MPKATLFWLDPGELAALLTEPRDAIRTRAKTRPAPDRAPYLFSAVLFPTQPPSDPT